ncbi:MAG: glycoside hydrolase family 15 protein [Acidimicrobiales bacterium]
MPTRIDGYAFLSDTESSALIGIDGSVDWFTAPRFDSPACFAALLGTERHGRWLLTPVDPVVEVRRRYRPGTLVLDSEVRTEHGLVRISECMPIRRDDRVDLIRQVEVVEGRVPMRTELVARMDYGSVVPLVRRCEQGVRFVAGPDSLTLSTPIELDLGPGAISAEFDPEPGRPVGFCLAWSPSYHDIPGEVDVGMELREAQRWWERWSSQRTTFAVHDDDIAASLVVLKGLTFAPSGGIVAAATTSLPEQIGGERNWDYRYSWLRDATFALTSLRDAGFTEEAASWRDWLLRAVAGTPDRIQVVYGPCGERRLHERELPWLPGHRSSGPVRVGNQAHTQLQLDVYGEVLDALNEAELVSGHPDAWSVGREIAETARRRWRHPDDGIWEVRGRERHFTHSKVMAWVALDRAIAIAGRVQDVDDRQVARWRHERDQIHAEVLERGVDDDGVFVQELDGTALDASLLLVPLVGFLPADDPRVEATTDAIAHRLSDRGFVRRYDPDEVDDGVGGDEGAFLLCTLWLAEVRAQQGRLDEAEEVFERVLGVRNDVGLLSEMCDPRTGELLGNLPQAFSHTGVVATGVALSRQHAGETNQAPRRG